MRRRRRCLRMALACAARRAPARVPGMPCRVRAAAFAPASRPTRRASRLHVLNGSAAWSRSPLDWWTAALPRSRAEGVRGGWPVLVFSCVQAGMDGRRAVRARGQPVAARQDEERRCDADDVEGGQQGGACAAPAAARVLVRRLVRAEHDEHSPAAGGGRVRRDALDGELARDRLHGGGRHVHRTRGFPAAAPGAAHGVFHRLRRARLGQRPCPARSRFLGALGGAARAGCVHRPVLSCRDQFHHGEL